MSISYGKPRQMLGLVLTFTNHFFKQNVKACLILFITKRV